VYAPTASARESKPIRKVVAGMIPVQKAKIDRDSPKKPKRKRKRP
jgi:hypothetical protein